MKGVEISMVKEDVNIILEEVIREAQAVNIPVPSNINKQVYINPRPKRRFGCCSTKSGKFNIEIVNFF